VIHELTSSRPCPKCAHDGPHPMTLRTSGVHYADVRCAKCNQHFFQSKPDDDPTKYKRPQQHRDLVTEFSRGYCELCLRHKEELPKCQTLEAQHVIEYQDGGSSDRSNIWIVCTACHRMIHWMRTYHGEAAMKVATALTAWKSNENQDRRNSDSASPT
jgi:hypothetical protein